MKKEDGWRVAAYIKPSARPRVQEGQFIGRVGNSGNSGGPHLHMSRHRVTDPGDDNNADQESEGKLAAQHPLCLGPFVRGQQVT